jgi:hypothetical protein
LDAQQERSDLSLYLSGDVLLKSYSSNNQLRGGMTALAWRDAVVAARLEIADRNYQAFKNELYAETAGLNLGVDLAALGLTGAAAVAGGGAAQALAAAATGVIGAGTAFNKDALYAKTLPAIFAQMEANRTQVLLRIRNSQLNNEIQYPLSLALSDVTAYERAGTLEAAIEALTTSATNQADSNKKQLAQLTGLTVLPSDVQARKQSFSDYIQSLVSTNQKAILDQIANKLGVATDPNIRKERANILELVDLRGSSPVVAG